MAEITDVFVAAIEGPKGKAEIYRCPLPPTPGGAEIYEFQVRFQGQTEGFRAIGMAYIVAGELAGTKT